MDYHILALIIAVFIYLLAPTSFDSQWVRRIARLIAILLAIWGLTIFHPIVAILVISVVLGLILWFGIDGISKSK